MEKQQSVKPTAAPLVVELVGLAGAGKTTVTQALTHNNPQIARKIVLPRGQMNRHLAAHTLAFLPTYLRHFPRLPWFTREEMRGMIYLTAWPEFLSQPGTIQPPVQLLDLGPAYRLTFLQEFGSPLTQQPRFTRWCEEVIQRWRRRLHLLIWLDAPNAVLLERINQRAKDHTIKARSADESAAFFSRYRAGFERIIGQFATQPDLAVLRLDTSQYSVQQIREQVTMALAQYQPIVG
jgi:thymidylate kinase